MRWTKKTGGEAATNVAAATGSAVATRQTAIPELERARASLGRDRPLAASPRREEAVGAGAVGAGALGALAVGSLAIGALALGALAVGAFAVGRLSVGRARIGTADIGVLRIGALEIDAILTPPAPSDRAARPFGHGDPRA